MKIDVVLLLYNRPDHSAEVLDSLIGNGVERVRAYMDYSDAPGVLVNQDRMLETIASRPQVQVDLYRHSQRLGLAASVRFAMNAALADADAAIVLEDDCVVRPGGIDFFKQGLSRLRDDHRVRSICGYLFPCPFIREHDEPMLLQRFSSWGWATWRDRWAEHNPDLSVAVKALADRGIRIEDVAGDLAQLCRSPNYLENRVDAWSVPWVLEHFATGTFAVYPPESMVDNIGFDGTGQHCPPSSVFSAGGPAPTGTWNWDRLVHRPTNEEMLRHFMDQHGLDIYPES